MHQVRPLLARRDAGPRHEVQEELRAHVLRLRARVADLPERQVEVVFCVLRHAAAHLAWLQLLLLEQPCEADSPLLQQG